MKDDQEKAIQVSLRKETESSSAVLPIFTIWFDGGSVRRCAYGSFEVQGDGLKFKVVRQDFGSPISSNQAEYLSLIAALKFLVAWPNALDGNVNIFTDSELVEMQLLGRYRVRHRNMIPLHATTLGLLKAFNGWHIEWQSRSHNVRRFGH